MRRSGAIIPAAFALLLVSAVATGSATPSVGRIVEYRIPSPGAPEGIAAGPDRALWFSERYTDQIGRVTRRGKFTIYSLGSISNMTADITAGPDGALWFTFPNNTTPFDSGKIGRITTGGAATFFRVPWIGDPEAITAGPDGNLWFTDRVAAAIGRVTTSGAITKFPIPGPSGSYPYNIATGSDGALWFTDFNGLRIGRLTTTGQTSFYPVPIGHGRPDAITAGPDGNLWFSLDDAGAIGRITPGGAMVDYPIPHPSGDYVFIAGLATGPDGALWFTYEDYTSQTSKIGRITTTGNVALFPTPTANSSPHGITRLGTRMWFTETAARNIGKSSTS